MYMGYKKPVRNGETISLPGLSLTTPVPVKIEFPIITSRRIHTRGIFGELAAFLDGATTLESFTKRGCNYWKHNAAQWGPNHSRLESEYMVGRIYGAQWRDWGPGHLDQLQMLIDGIAADPHGRRHILTTWNPGELYEMCLPPCHLLAQFYVHNDELDCIVYMRSVDLALGLPSDLVLYGLLLALVAKQLDYVAGRLTMHFGDAHVYVPHLQDLDRQMDRKVEPNVSPKLVLNPCADIFTFEPEEAVVIDYNPLEGIQYELF